MFMTRDLFLFLFVASLGQQTRDKQNLHSESLSTTSNYSSRDGSIVDDGRNRDHDLALSDESCEEPEGEIMIHPPTGIYVYMMTSSGGPPFKCPDCDYKTTVDYLYTDHRLSDHSDHERIAS